MMRLIAALFLSLFLVVPVFAESESDYSPCLIQDGVDLISSPAPLPEQDDWTDTFEDPLAGRLGSTGDAWYEVHIYFNEDDSMMSWDGCGPLTGYQAVQDADGRPVVNINLYADRPADIEAGTLSNPSDANWSQEEALFIAHRLLPQDVVLGEPTTTDVGNIKYSGHSDTLAERMPQEALDYVGASGEPGDVQVILYLSTDGTVYAIDIQVGGYGEA